MLHVSIDHLRHNLADVLSRVSVLGEEVTLTRAGKPVALLSPLPGFPIGSDAQNSMAGQETALAGKSGSAA